MKIIKPLPYKDTLGKRDIVKTMLDNKMPLSEICKIVGATREEFDQCYGDLYDRYIPVAYIPTEEDSKIVWRMTSYGMTQKAIAQRLGITTDVLTQHYRREINNAKDELIDEVATNLVMQAKEGSVQASIFLLKARANWKETSVNEVKAEVTVEQKPLSALTDEELEIAESIATKLSYTGSNTAGEVKA